jgi:hypothetical protein
MRLPGTRYQEYGWEQVRKLLGQCSLDAFARCEPARLLDPDKSADGLALYIDLVAESLHERAFSPRARALGNSYGDSVLELCLTLVYELQARPADWDALRAALAHEQARLDAPLLRKKINDMYATLRDKVDADNYQAACGRPCSANRMYAYRMLDTAYGDIARLFASWRENARQVGAILGREIVAEPIEARQLGSIGDCRPEWVLAWSESLADFTGNPGPLHTRSKRFAALKGSPGRIGAMLREIGQYEELSSNRDRDWLLDADTATAWLDDYWRVLAESEQAATPGPDQILEAIEDELERPDEPESVVSSAIAHEPDEHARQRAQSLALPPRFLELAEAAGSEQGWSTRAMAADALPVRLAVYLKLLGPVDDSYPLEWLDPTTGALPTMQQLAGLARISLPTLRKRRDAAIERLHEMARSAKEKS